MGRSVSKAGEAELAGRAEKMGRSARDNAATDLLMAFAGGLGIWIAMVQCHSVAWLSVEGVSWMLIGMIVASNVAGFHVLWTWTHATVSILIVITGSEFGIGVCSAIGVLIAVPWYGLLIRYRSLVIPVRLVRGWTPFTLTSLGYFLGDAMGWRPSEQAPTTMLVGFHFIDIGAHFIPPLLLLKLGAPHISPAAVVIAHMLSRGWIFWVSHHHYKFCPKALATGSILTTQYHDDSRSRAAEKKQWQGKACRNHLSVFVDRWVRFKGFVDVDAVNFVYGLSPPIPPEALELTIIWEFVSAAVLLCMACFLPLDWRTAVFFHLSGGSFVSMGTMLRAAAVFCVIGVSIIFVGSVFSFRAHLRTCRSAGASAGGGSASVEQPRTVQNSTHEASCTNGVREHSTS